MDGMVEEEEVELKEAEVLLLKERFDVDAWARPLIGVV